MKKRNMILLASSLSMMLFTGCTTSTQYVGPDTKKESPITMGIDRKDFEKAAGDMIDSLLSSGALAKKGGGRYIVMISDIVNDTTQRIDTKMLTKKIRIAMLNSGQAVITTAVGNERDDKAQDVRKLRGNKEFKQNTIAKTNSLYAPEMSLSGDILQRAAKTDDGDQLVEYYFQLTLTEIESGLAFWEEETVVGKLGSNDSVTW